MYDTPQTFANKASGFELLKRWAHDCALGRPPGQELAAGGQWPRAQAT